MVLLHVLDLKVFMFSQGRCYYTWILKKHLVWWKNRNFFAWKGSNLSNSIFKLFRSKLILQKKSGSSLLISWRHRLLGLIQKILKIYCNQKWIRLKANINKAAMRLSKKNFNLSISRSQIHLCFLKGRLNLKKERVWAKT